MFWCRCLDNCRCCCNFHYYVTVQHETGKTSITSLPLRGWRQHADVEWAVIVFTSRRRLSQETSFSFLIKTRYQYYALRTKASDETIVHLVAIYRTPGHHLSYTWSPFNPRNVVKRGKTITNDDMKNVVRGIVKNIKRLEIGLELSAFVLQMWLYFLPKGAFVSYS